jgi:hypothetical protein
MYKKKNIKCSEASTYKLKTNLNTHYLFYAILDKHRQGYYGKHMLTLLNNSTQVYVKVNKGKYDSLRNEPQIVSFRISIIVEMHYGKIYTIFLSSTLQN